MKIENMEELFLAEIEDLYDCEKRLTKALPKMAKAANSEELRAAFAEHLEQTKGHVERLEKVFESMGLPAKTKPCAGMKGLLEEGQEVMGEDATGQLMDAALIGAAQRVEHYEIAAYGCVKTWAGLLGETEAQSLLEQTLNEEKATNDKLTELSEDINLEAKEEGEAGEEETERKPARGKARSAKA